MTDPGTSPSTRGDALSVALHAYDALAIVAETVADEWTYVSRLAEAGRTRLARAAGPQPDLDLSPEASRAIAGAVAEIGLIADPHRAIDWLSTFPAVVELALGPGSEA